MCVNIYIYIYIYKSEPMEFTKSVHMYHRSGTRPPKEHQYKPSGFAGLGFSRRVNGLLRATGSMFFKGLGV